MRSYSDIDSLFNAEFKSFDRLYVVPKPGGANPYLRRLYKERLQSGGARAPVFLSPSQVLKPWTRRILGRERAAWSQHWLQFSTIPTFIRTNLRLLGSALFVWSGGQILWTIHNERPHAGTFIPLNHWYCKQLAKLVHRFHIHHEGAAEFVRREYGASDDRIVILPHPPYEVTPVPQKTARKGLSEKYGINTADKTLVLMFGFITPYKGVEEVASIVAELARPDLLLLVAGPVNEMDKAYVQSLKATLETSNIILLDGYVPEDDVTLFMSAADCVVFNHKRSLTSGAMQLASDYGRMILAPAVQAVAAFPSDRLEIFRSREELAQRLAKATQVPQQ